MKSPALILQRIHDEIAVARPDLAVEISDFLDGFPRPAEVPCMSIVCAWCQKDLGVKRCEPRMDGHVSHGMCTACADEMRKVCS